MRSILLFMFGFLLLFSCTKFGKNITVKGRVYDPVSQQGIAGAVVKLQHSTGGYNGGYKTVKSVVSDADGYYELDKLGLASYRITCETVDRYDLGFTTDNGQTFASNFYLTVKKGKIMHADYYTVGYGQMKIGIHNLNCSGSTDSLIYNRKYISAPNVEIFQPFILTGCYDNEGAFATVPEGVYLVTWRVIRNGAITDDSYTMYVGGDSQATYVINY